MFLGNETRAKFGFVSYSLCFIVAECAKEYYASKQ